MMMAAHVGSVDVMEDLIKREDENLKVNAINDRGLSALAIAVRQLRPDIVRRLLRSQLVEPVTGRKRVRIGYDELNFVLGDDIDMDIDSDPELVIEKMENVTMMHHEQEGKQGHAQGGL